MTVVPELDPAATLAGYATFALLAVLLLSGLIKALGEGVERYRNARHDHYRAQVEEATRAARGNR